MPRLRPSQRAVIVYVPARALCRVWPEAVKVPCAPTRVVIAPSPAKLRPARARERTKTVLPRGQLPAVPKTRTRPPGATRAGHTRTLGRVCAGDRLRLAPARAGFVVPVPECRFFASTEIEAVPVVPAAVAVIVPLPTAVALKLVVPAGFGENVPSTGETDQVAVTGTGFP
jgi:hypothetical protein